MRVKTFGFCVVLASLAISLPGCSSLTSEMPSATQGSTAEDSLGHPSPAPVQAEFVYVANLGPASTHSGSISGYAIDRHSGKLVPVPGSPFPAEDGPSTIASDPHGDHVFVLEKTFSLPGEPCSHVKGVLLSENVHELSGTLSLADKITLDGSCPASLAVDPRGKFLYVGMETTDAVGLGKRMLGEIQVFAIQANGKLREIAGSPFQVAPPLQSLAMHPDGKLLYAATGDDRNGIVVFIRDPETGSLSLPITVASRPQSMLAIGPDDDFMIGDSPSVVDQVTLFRINEVSGDLTAQSPMAIVLPWGISVHPSGKFAAIAATRLSPGLPGEILIYRMDSSSSGMTQVPGPAASAGNGTFDVKFDAQGSFVYAVAENDNSIAGFSFNGSSGALTPVPGSPFQTGQSPIALTVVRPK